MHITQLYNIGTNIHLSTYEYTRKIDIIEIKLKIILENIIKKYYNILHNRHPV